MKEDKVVHNIYIFVFGKLNFSSVRIYTQSSVVYRLVRGGRHERWGWPEYEIP